MLNYDPDKKPQLDQKTLENALKLGLHPINVICDEPNAKVGDHSGVSFIAFVAFLPQVGDRIELQDGRVCVVERVYYRVSQIGENAMFSLVPNIYAIRKDATAGS